ncbi:O-antigen polymerase [Idiomarina sp.]|uniref:O-antigen polymerase n=1 Tax=Idiomarina sp. TaxID=1874361 RepID=UPI0025BDA5C4|nr:O-antigen polymerase [Idiomarina sp.]NQZ04705.1 oligosaccharide repeat unit polymerase [Idiomarina sp.]
MVGVALYILVIVFALALLLLNKNRIRSNIGLLFMLLAYCLFYGLSGVHSSFSYEKDVELMNLKYSRENSLIFLGGISTLVSLLVSYLSYTFLSKHRYGKSDCLMQDNGNGLVLYGWLPLLFSMFSLYLYSLQYGGIAQALSAAAMIRAGLYKESVGSFTFFKYFIPIFLIGFSFWFLKYLFTKRVKHLFYFLIYFGWGVYAFSFMAGRTRFVFLLLLPLIFWVLQVRKVKIKSIITTFLLTLTLVLGIVNYGKSVFVGLSTDNYQAHEVKSEESSLIGYFTHRVYANEVAWGRFIELNEVYGFNDVFFAPLFIIPERLTGIKKPDSISYHTTEVLTGVYDSMIPPGVVALGLFSFNVVGLVFVSIIYGAIFALFDNKIARGNTSSILYILGVLYWFYYGSSGDVRIIVNSFAFFIPVLFFYYGKIFIFRTMRGK